MLERVSTLFYPKPTSASTRFDRCAEFNQLKDFLQQLRAKELKLYQECFTEDARVHSEENLDLYQECFAEDAGALPEATLTKKKYDVFRSLSQLIDTQIKNFNALPELEDPVKNDEQKLYFLRYVYNIVTQVVSEHGKVLATPRDLPSDASKRRRATILAGAVLSAFSLPIMLAGTIGVNVSFRHIQKSIPPESILLICFFANELHTLIKQLQKTPDEKPNYYAVLGLEEGASLEEVARRYRRLAREYHPDKHTDETQDELTAKFFEISTAYRALCDILQKSEEHLDHSEEHLDHSTEVRRIAAR